MMISWVRHPFSVIVGGKFYARFSNLKCAAATASATGGSVLAASGVEYCHDECKLIAEGYRVIV